jgi:3-deoxy-D-manno-octulosonic-acid transferase
MLFLYDVGIRLYNLLILLASVKNKKAAAWIKGRKNILQYIESQVKTNKKHIWFHFASLGEFEQGRPVLEELKDRHPELPVVITFFSPSGYEIRKNFPLADHVFYLPSDTSLNAKELIRIIQPAMAIFTKYEYWYHYFHELSENRIPLYMISAIFRKDQPFFKWYGGLHRKMLSAVSHFFVQDTTSKELLGKAGFKNVSITGDTRFDRVIRNSKEVQPVRKVADFCEAHNVFIAGSTWPDDEELILALTKVYTNWKFIIAPHEVKPARIRQIEKLFPDQVRYSTLNEGGASPQVLVIDNIGMLSGLYQYAHIAYIGGGFGSGIHNIQEAVVFGLPVLFGPEYRKFKEAVDLVEKGAAFSVKNEDELLGRMDYLKDDTIRIACSGIAKGYVLENAGATQKILDYIERQTPQS